MQRKRKHRMPAKFNLRPQGKEDFHCTLFIKITIFKRRCTEIISRVTVELGYDVPKVTEHMASHK